MPSPTTIGPGSAKALAEALKINPRHVDSLLLQVDELIDSERYAEAGKVLEQVFEVNPREPRAWAYRAVLAHLAERRRRRGRGAAGRPWRAGPTNPEVDHLIGRKLAQKYRFAEGAAYQRRALELDPDYLPAKIQLCQDLLRLGDEAEGWKLADEIFAEDGYNVVAYNLITLRDRLAGFRTLEDDGFVVRMDPREADLYGPRVLALLRRAKATLCEKYGVTLPEPGDRRDLPAEEGIRRADLRPARGRRPAGRLLRPGDHGQQPGVAGRASLELGGRALARVLPCGHPEQDAQQDAALAQRGDLGLRGGAAGPRLGERAQPASSAR